MDDESLTPEEAGQLLKMSPAYLRRSDCPKVLMPPSRGTRPTVRYVRADILAWRDHWKAQSTRTKRKAS